MNQYQLELVRFAFDAGLTLVPRARLELAWLAPTDFKSVVYTDFTTRAFNEFIIQQQLAICKKN